MSTITSTITRSVVSNNYKCTTNKDCVKNELGQCNSDHIEYDILF